MGQYMLKNSKDFIELKNAIKNYKAHSILISPFSMGDRTELIKVCLENKIFEFSIKNNLSFFANKKKIISLIPDKPRRPFKIEYQDKNFARLWINNYHPMDSHLPIPTYSTLRNVIDDLLIEIRFKGKIKIKYDHEEDGQTYWKIIK